MPFAKGHYFKTIVTAEAKLDLERKGVQSYQRDIYARFLCFGNGALTSLYDHSDGFFRRQLILTTKDKPTDRMDDPFPVSYTHLLFPFGSSHTERYWSDLH